MSSIVFSPPQGIIFLLDPGNKDAIIPDDVQESIVMATESCVSVWTQAEVDGDTEVTLSASQDIPGGLFQVAIVEIVLPHHVLAVVTSEDEVILKEDVPQDRAKVSIWVDDKDNPGQVFVRVE